jgi:hypothetical protein
MCRGVGDHCALRENACISYVRKIMQFYNGEDLRQVKKLPISWLSEQLRITK